MGAWHYLNTDQVDVGEHPDLPQLRRPTMYARLHSDPQQTQETPASEAKPVHFTSERAWDKFALNPVINGQQMRTLIDPVEHQEHVTHSVDVQGYGSMDRMWSEKEEEAREHQTTGVHGAGIYDWMERGDRQRSPITLRVDPGQEGYGQGEGHHRVAAAAALQRESGEVRPLKFKAEHVGYLGGSKGWDETPSTDDEPTRWRGEDEPSPTPSSQRETPRMMTPANQPKLGARTSRLASFTFDPAHDKALRAALGTGKVKNERWARRKRERGEA
jgi:hypothetical protein